MHYFEISFFSQFHYFIADPSTRDNGDFLLFFHDTQKNIQTIFDWANETKLVPIKITLLPNFTGKINVSNTAKKFVMAHDVNNSKIIGHPDGISFLIGGKNLTVNGGKGGDFYEIEWTNKKTNTLKEIDVYIDNCGDHRMDLLSLDIDINRLSLKNTLNHFIWGFLCTRLRNALPIN